MAEDERPDGEDADIVELPFGVIPEEEEAAIVLPEDPELRAALEEVSAALGVDASDADAEVDTDVETNADADAEDEAEADSDAETDSEVNVGADFTHDDYRDATTEAYAGLADMVREADEADDVEQSMSVQIPGLGSGVVGFDDITQDTPAAPEEAPDEFDEEILAEIEARRARRRTLQQRMATGLGLVGIVALAVYFGAVWFVALVGLITFLAAGEFYAASRKSGYNPVAGIGLLGVVGAFVASWYLGAAGIAVAAVITLLVLILFYVVNERRNPLANLGVTALGLLWVGSTMAFLAPITRADGWEQLAGLIVLSVAGHDVGAFFVGRQFGSHLLAPQLSPKKTIEGLVGGIALGFGMAIGLSYLPWFSDVIDLQLALVAGAVVAVVAPLGDLSESLVKRSLETKDMGTLLPGHGGVLDRIDGFIFAIPAFFLAFTLLGLLP
ncbi:MAG: phosphatidate cytidylyltransferase [Acidimicrobiia bacterium]|nr:phosphatidate cytidylyltransferase [Acidimicrobiia bacterium]